MLTDLLTFAAGLALAAALVAGAISLYGWRRRLTFGRAWRALLTPPASPDTELNRQSGLLSALLQRFLVLVLIVGPPVALFQDAADRPQTLLIVACGLAFNLALYLLLRRGYAYLASRAFPLGLFLLVSWGLGAGRLTAPLASGYLVVIIGAGLLLGGRAAVAYAVLSMLALPAIYLLRPAESSAALPLLVATWLVYSGVFVMSALLLALAAHRIGAALAEADNLREAEAQHARALSVSLEAERKRATRMALLADIARQLTGLNDLKSLLDETVRRVAEGFGYEYVGLYLVEAELLVRRASHGLFSAAASPQAPGDALSHGPVAWTARTGETAWVTTAASDDRYVPHAHGELVCAVAVPLRLAKSVVGVLDVESTRPGAFEAEDVRTLESLAHLIVSGLQTAQLVGQLRTRQQMTEALRRVGAAMNASLELPEVVGAVCDETLQAFQADAVEVWLLQTDGALHRAGACGRPSDGPPDRSLEDLLPAARAMSEKRTLLLAAGPNSAEARWLSSEWPSMRSALVVPLINESLRLGVLLVAEASRALRYEAEAAAAGNLLAAQVAAAIENARLYAEGRRRADQLARLNDITRDALTIADYGRLLEALAGRLVDLLGADACRLVQWDPDRQVPILAEGFATADGTGPIAGPSLTASVLEAGTAQVVAAAAQTDYRDLARALPSGTSTVLALPLIAGGQRLGAALAGYWQPRTFTADERAQAEQAAGQIALALAKGRALEAERRRHTELEALREASLRLTARLQLREVLEALLEQTFKLVPAYDAHIFLYDGQQLAFGAALWADGAHNVPFSVPRPGGITDTVARTGQRIVVPDVNQDPLFTAWQWGGAIAGLPLRVGERVRGVMNVAFDRPHHFDPHELRVLEMLADQAAIALENARLYEEEREQREFAEALRSASMALSGTLDLETLLDRLLDQVERVVPSDAAAIVLLRPETGQLEAVRQRGRRAREADIRAFAAGAGRAPDNHPQLRAMLHTRQAAIIADTSLYSGWVPEAAPGARAWAGAPIIANQQVIGFLALARADANAYQPLHAGRLAAFAGQAGLALQNARLYEAEHQRAAQLSLLAEVGQQVAGILDETGLLERVVEAMISRLGFADAAMLTWSGPKELQVVAIATTEQMAAHVGFRQQADVGIIGRAVTLRSVYWTNDVGRDPYYFDPGGRNVGSAMALPLMREGDLMGVLYLETSAPGAFSTSDVLAFSTLAQHVATAMDNARLYARARTRLRDLTALQSVSQTVASSLDLDHVMLTVVQLLHDTFGYQRCSVYQLFGEVLQLKSQVGYEESHVIREIPISRGVSGRAVRTREAQFVRDVGGDPDFLEALPGARSEICVPLLKDRMVLGTLNVESEQEDALTEADVFLLTTLAGQVTVAIENARLFRAEREQRELAEALRDASSALSDSLDIDIIMDRLLLLIERVVPYDMANLLLYDPAYGRVHAARQRGVEAFGAPVAARMSTLSLDVRTTANLERMLETRRSHIIPDTAQDPHWIPVAATPFVRSWLGAPIVTQGEVIGFFSLDKCEAGYYQPEHAERLSAFAGQAALVMQNARLFEVQQKRAEEQRLLWHASQDFTAGLSQEAVLQAVVAHMTTAVQTARCTVSLWERTKDAVVTLQDYAPDRPEDVVPLGTPYALGDYPATRAVLETRRPQIVRADDPDADAAEVALLRHNGHAAVMMLPLDTGEQVFGLVELFRNADMLSFAETDVQLARSLAAQAAVALENSRLHMALQDNLHELDALLKANQALLSTLELDPLLDNILAAAVGAIPAAEKGRITLIDASGERLAVRAVHGYADPRVKALVQARHQGFAARVIRDNAPLLLADTHAEPGAWHHGGLPELNRVRSSVMAPLAAKGPGSSAFGVISMESSRPGAFGDRDLRVLGAFANTAAVAIDNARLHAEVQRLAVTDSLTGLANPRAFEHALVTEFSRAQRYGYALSLVIMDIDSFKVYNDTFGHPAGNERLKAIAEVLRESVREPDLPVRYGGEEFALLLPHTAKAGAEALAERVREAAEQSAPRRPRKGDPMPGYTLSLGVAAFPQDALTADDLVVAADYAELAAKRAGKNRVCVAEPLPPAAEPLPAASD